MWRALAPLPLASGEMKPTTPVLLPLFSTVQPRNRLAWPMITTIATTALRIPLLLAVFQPNGFGVHDILGNVWEWVDGCWHDTCEGIIADTGDCYFRVMRGGAWNSEPDHVRAALRIRDDQDVRDKVSGFRVARTLPQ